MEGRIKKYGQLSPGRAKVWTEKSPKYHYNHNYASRQQQQQEDDCNLKVPVVYYLTSNHQLEHPHFMEVPLSSPDGLHLKDVIERLNALRGRGIAAKYSWSCKRSYKNGYVWHDICEDDLILPAHGNEYVLKGSELFEETFSGNFSPAGAIALHEAKTRSQPRHRDESSSSSNLNARIGRSCQTDNHSSPHQRSSSSAASPDSSIIMKEPPSSTCSCRLIDASTQTDPDPSRVVEDAPCNTEFVSTPTSSPGYVMNNTLESLIRDDIRKLKSFQRSLATERHRAQPSMKLKPANLIMQLISCGSIYVKDHYLDMVPSYNHSFSHSKFSSPRFDLSSVSTENAHKDQSKDYFSESFAQSMLISNWESEKPRCQQMRQDPTLSPWRIQSSRYARNEASMNGGSQTINQENVNKIEERLASGTRIVIHSSETV